MPDAPHHVVPVRPLRELDYLARTEAPRRKKFEDVLHALINHTEFLFQHGPPPVRTEEFSTGSQDEAG